MRRTERAAYRTKFYSNLSSPTRFDEEPLFHDIYPETIRAVPQVIDYLKEQGYRITTVGDLLGHPTAVENYYGRNDHRPVQ
ncbi:hypothetical protein OK7_03876 [Enterococcus faecium EnGen0024]|nr:hypothetical protein OK7_03876 [Enterococcus faecium EnGen0024]